YDQIRSAIAKFDGYIGTDLPFFAADHWCPGNSNNRMFGNRRAAHKLVRVGYLEEEGLFGDTVNVVVIDRGSSRQQMEDLGGRYGGGWEYDDGSCSLEPGITPDGHGMMVVRNIFKIAPKVRFFDCPLLPEHIGFIPAFLDLAEAAYQRMIADIKALRHM